MCVCVHRQHDNDHSSAARRIIYDLELNATAAARQSNRSTSRDIRNRRMCVCVFVCVIVCVLYYYA